MKGNKQASLWSYRWGFALCAALFASNGQAGDASWTESGVSPALNYANRPIISAFKPPASVASGTTARITAVHAVRSYSGNARVVTSLCWNGTVQCIELTGPSITTHAFDGFDPGKPIYLVHRAVGKDGPLSAPVFVKGSVVVWYAP